MKRIVRAPASLDGVMVCERFGPALKLTSSDNRKRALLKEGDISRTASSPSRVRQVLENPTWNADCRRDRHQSQIVEAG